MPKSNRRQAIDSKNSNTAAIIFRNVTKIYPAQPDEPALDNVSVQIDKGEFAFLVGHSGSGKSTFIRMIIKEVEPNAGTIIVGGYDLNTIRASKVPYLRRNIGCVFQDYKLLENKTAFENVSFAMECIGKSRREIQAHVPEVLKLVGLEDKADKKPGELSGGEQQRVSIARAIINRPPVLICDEPTGNLDPKTSAGIMELLDRINSTGTTVLIATHDQETVNQMKKRVIRLEDGKIISDEKNGEYRVQ